MGGLVHEHADAVDRPAPRGRRAADEPGVSSGVVRRGRPRPGRRRAATGRRASRGPADRRAHAHRVAFTTRSAPTPRRRARRPGPGPASAAAACSASAGCGSPRPPRPRPPRPAPATTARAAPPAPSTTAPLPGRVDAVVEPERVDEAGAVGAVARRAVRRGPRRMFTAPSACGRRRQAVDRPAATSACSGMVTDSPARPRAAAPRSAAAPPASATSKARYTQSSPTAAKAALCSTGESEWRDGRADAPPRPGGAAAGRPTHEQDACSPGLGDVRLVVGQVGGEGVLAARRRPARSTARRTASRRGSCAGSGLGAGLSAASIDLPARAGDRRRRQAEVM